MGQSVERTDTCCKSSRGRPDVSEPQIDRKGTVVANLEKLHPLGSLNLLDPRHLLLPRRAHPLHPNPLPIHQLPTQRRANSHARQRQRTQPYPRPPRRERRPPAHATPNRIPAYRERHRIQHPVHSSDRNARLHNLVAAHTRIGELLVSPVQAVGAVDLVPFRCAGGHGRDGCYDAQGVGEEGELGDLG